MARSPVVPGILPAGGVLRRALLLACLGAGSPLLAGCGSRPPRSDADRAADLVAQARAHYDAYGKTLAAGNRSAIASFYHRDGALRVFNGDGRRQAWATIDSTYRGRWAPPAYFTWDSLRFDALPPDEVIVTGGFLWQGEGQADTGRYIYAGLLQVTDSGAGIRFEHETARPAP